MIYSIDTSALLDGWVRHYPPDVFPALWDRIDELIKDGKLRATEEVLFELEKKSDDVYKWVKSKSFLFVPIDDDIQITVRTILHKHERLVDARKNRSAADPFVIALAQLNGCKVVTAELSSNNLRKPHIPDVCRALNIPSINFLQLVREEEWRF
ncbi:MAG: DUF4411 family protein [Thermodesulfovibrionia bacterium]|nr:DUF4411 family protein [Thermodesulfovibrionia bacterium]